MMICPETYYKNELAGKTPKQILSRIAGLRREISEMKRVMEHPDYTPKLCPSEDVRISCMRDYLECAKKALFAAGEAYTPTAAEKKDEEFATAIESIDKITLETCGYFSGIRTYTVYMEESVRYERTSMSVPPMGEETVTKAELCRRLADIHMGEWQRHYSPARYGICVMDGTTWRVTVTYKDGSRPFLREGDNVYPYNFRQFADIMGASADLYAPEEAEVE